MLVVLCIFYAAASHVSRTIHSRTSHTNYYISVRSKCWVGTPPYQMRMLSMKKYKS